jgi:serine O-acetyltransferase
MMGTLRADFANKRRIYAADGGQAGALRILLSDGSSAMVLYRCMRFFARCRLGAVAWAVQWLNKFVNGCVIGVGAEFGPGFVILHPVGIVINSKVRAGSRVALEGGVVIGDEKGRSPILGDDVFVGSGAKVVGGIAIGHRARIGANAVVLRSVDDDTTAVGIPARPVSRRVAA